MTINFLFWTYWSEESLVELGSHQSIANGPYTKLPHQPFWSSQNVLRASTVQWGKLCANKKLQVTVDNYIFKLFQLNYTYEKLYEECNKRQMNQKFQKENNSLLHQRCIWSDCKLPENKALQLLTKAKEELQADDRVNAVYKVKSGDRDKCCLHQTGRNISRTVYRYNQATIIHDALSLISVYEDQ